MTDDTLSEESEKTPAAQPLSIWTVLILSVIWVICAALTYTLIQTDPQNSALRALYIIIDGGNDDLHATIVAALSVAILCGITAPILIAASVTGAFGGRR